MSIRLKFASLLAGLLFAGSVAAWQQPKVEYSADSNMETADSVTAGRVNYAPGKERREYIEGGEKMIMIIRQDKQRVWMLMPEEKMYIDTKITKDRKDDMSAYKIEQSRVGEETVNGVRTTKHKVIMTGPKGDKLGGFFWLTKEDILMKMDAISVEKGSKERIKIELKNLKVGAQDPKLFEIPPGYSAGMGGLGGMMGGMMGGGDEKKETKAQPKGGEEKGGGGFGLQDALKLLR